MTDAILRHNATCDRARAHFMAKHGAPELPPAKSVLEMVVQQDVYSQWRRASGYDAFMERVRSRSFRAQGFKRCEDAPGWKHD